MGQGPLTMRDSNGCCMLVHIGPAVSQVIVLRLSGRPCHARSGCGCLRACTGPARDPPGQPLARCDGQKRPGERPSQAACSAFKPRRAPDNRQTGL